MESRAALNILGARLAKLEIEVEFVLNYPWVYLDSINGIKVKERHFSKHGYTIAFFPIKLGEKLKFVNPAGMFKLIRKYKSKTLKTNKLRREQTQKE